MKGPNILGAETCFKFLEANPNIHFTSRGDGLISLIRLKLNANEYYELHKGKTLAEAITNYLSDMESFSKSI